MPSKIINEEMMLDLFLQGKTVKEIAVIMGYCVNTVTLHLRKMQVLPPPVHVDRNLIVSLIKEGKTLTEIQTVTSAGKTTVRTIARENELNIAREPSLPSLRRDKIKALYEKGKTSAEIGKELGLKSKTISDTLYNMGLKPHPSERIRELQTIPDEFVLERFKQGLTYAQIAEESGGVLTPGNVRTRIRRLGLKRKKVLDEEEVLELHGQGLKDREIADRLGVCRSAITQKLNSLGISGRKSKIQDLELRERISQSLIGRYTGSKNPNYKGGTELKKLARGILKTFSKRILRERGYECAICGSKTGTKNVHHIIPFNKIFNDFKENAYSGNLDTFYDEIMAYEPFTDESNLIVLCENCHKNLHRKSCAKPEFQEGATTIESASENEDK